MLLLDNNLSPKLCALLQADFPNTLHVEQIALEHSSDADVRQYAIAQELVIVTKDSDFNQLIQLFGHPPKVIWLRCGNVPTTRILLILRKHKEHIWQFIRNPSIGLLEIY